MKNGVLMFLALCLSACASQAKLVEGNGHVVTREIPVEAFDEIHIGPSITNSGLLYNDENQKKRPEFRYSQEARKVLVVTADENLFSELDIRVRDGELTIRTKDNVRIRPSRLLIEGGSDRLNEVSISGSTRFSCMTSFEGDLLEVSVSGSGVADFPQSARLSNADLSVSGSGLVSLGQLTCERVDGQVSGSGCVRLKGEGQEIDYSVSGSGKVDGFDYHAKQGDCSVSGSGSIEVYASEELDLSVSGSGKIRYDGPANVRQSKSGSGLIQKAF